MLHNTVLLTSCDYNKEVKKSWMGKIHSMHKGETECIQGLGGKAKKKETARKT
jgi:hypothetical protein